MNILILHGWGSSSKKWSSVKEILENKGYKVFTPDLPGFGESSPPPQPWNINNYVKWLRRYVGDWQARGELTEPFFLLGHSFGGALAVKFSLEYPQQVKKLFLVAPALIREKKIKKEIIKKIAKIFSFLPQKIKRTIYRKILKSSYPLEPGIMRETYLKIISENLLGQLDQISLPVVIIWGKDDDITPLKHGHLINEKIKNSKLVIIENQNHDLNIRAPELLAELIAKNF